MKKLLFFICCFFFLIGLCNADDLVTFSSLSNRCSVVYGNKAIIGVKVVSLGNGSFSSLFSSYNLGNVYNNGSLVIEDVNGKIDRISVTNPINDNSNVYFVIDNDIEVKYLEDIAIFNLVYEFDEVPNYIDILGNRVILSDSISLCNSLNNYDISSLEDQSLDEIDHLRNNDKYLFLFIGIFIGILVYGVFMYGKSKRSITFK